MDPIDDINNYKLGLSYHYLRTFTVKAFLSLIGILIMACNYNSDEKLITESVVVYGSSVDEIEPPPPELTSNFKTIDEWLINICDHEKPTKSIHTYNVGLFEAPDNYTIFLVGVNRYDTNDNSITKVDFEPKQMYYRLPKSYFVNLKRNEVLERISSELHKFTKGGEFKDSFLVEAKSITTDFKGQETIWSR